MVFTCQGCRTLVELDLLTGHARTADGSTENLVYVDTSVIIWTCPVCEYPHADRAA